MNYLIRKKSYILLDRYDVLDENNHLVFTADGLLMRPCGRLTVASPDGDPHLTLHKHWNPFFANYRLASPDNPDETRGEIRQRFHISPHFKIKLGNAELLLEGDLRAHNFCVWQDMSLKARIRKRELRWGDTYILSIGEDVDPATYAAITVALDNALYHNR